jgi:recombination protein RecA
MAKATQKVVKPLDVIMKELEKDYGKGSVIHGEEPETYDKVVSTGSLGLDIALGIGGIPIGRIGKIIEVFGWESSGKTTLVKTIIANFQQVSDKKVLFLDGEGMEAKYARKLGVDVEDMFIVKVDASAGEGAYDKMQRLVESGKIGLVVVDSVSAFKPGKNINSKLSDSKMGLHSRMMSELMDKVNNLSVEHGCTFIFVNQLRQKIGVMFGNPETTQGGNALRFYAHIRLETTRSITKKNSIMNGKEKLGNLHKVSVVKNKLATPFKKAEFYIRYGEGIDTFIELVKLGHKLDVLCLSGNSVTYEGTKYTLIEFEQALQDNEGMLEEIRTKIINTVATNPTLELIEESDEEDENNEDED